MIEIIAFDADDTLWENEHLYHQAKKEFALILAKYSTPEQTSLRLNQIEVKNIDYYGYGIKGFTLSMIETALEVSQGQVEAQLIAELIRIAKGMLTAEVELVEGAKATLEKLSPRFDMMLITKGDRYEQERKIARSGIANYFRYLEVVAEKSETSYRQILERYNLDPARFIMVGNSLRSDILPVLRIGGFAVYIPNVRTWFHEHVPEDEFSHLKFDKLERLSDLPNYLARFIDQSLPPQP